MELKTVSSFCFPLSGQSTKLHEVHTRSGAGSAPEKCAQSLTGADGFRGTFCSSYFSLKSASSSAVSVEGLVSRGTATGTTERCILCGRCSSGSQGRGVTQVESVPPFWLWYSSAPRVGVPSGSCVRGVRSRYSRSQAKG